MWLFFSHNSDFFSLATEVISHNSVFFPGRFARKPQFVIYKLTIVREKLRLKTKIKSCNYLFYSMMWKKLIARCKLKIRRCKHGNTRTKSEFWVYISQFQCFQNSFSQNCYKKIIILRVVITFIVYNRNGYCFYGFYTKQPQWFPLKFFLMVWKKVIVLLCLCFTEESQTDLERHEGE